MSSSSSVSESSSTSSDGTALEAAAKAKASAPQRPSAPPRIPKIPPPPDEQPPPYTSFHAQTSSLLGSQRSTSAVNTAAAAANSDERTSNRRSPPGYRKYTQCLSKRNLIIAAVIFIAVVALIFGILILISDPDDDEDEREFSSRDRDTLPLTVDWKLLGEFRQPDQKISFDERTDQILLSRYVPNERILKCEKLHIGKYREGYIYSTHNVSDTYADCTRFTDEVICCATSPHGHQHRTDCFLNADNQVIHSVASHYDYMSDWQSIADGNVLLVVYNKQRHAILNLRTKRIHRIEENRLPHGYYAVAFFFPMDNADEIDQLVRSGEEFRICEYRANIDGDYSLQAPECRPTPFHIEYELPKVRFCSNPIYTALIQYGHVGDERDLTFHIKVIYDSTPNVYTATESLETPYEQLVIDCNDDSVEVYVMGKHEVAQFTVRLPDLYSEHFIRNRL